MLRSNAPDMLYFSVSDPFGKVVAGDTDLPQLRPPKDDQVEFANSVYHDMRVRVSAWPITACRNAPRSARSRWPSSTNWAIS